MAFLFSADFSALTLDGVLMALGQALFSLAIGVGMLITYGAYVPKDVSLTRAGIIIAGADSLVALLAGMAIFPVVFAVGLEANSGPGLIFETLPVAFAGMPGGVVLGTLFFVMLSLAAITTGFGMIEPAVAWLSRNTANVTSACHGSDRPFDLVGRFDLCAVVQCVGRRQAPGWHIH